MPDLLPILFTFALGCCVGSFLNVVVWRLPRVGAEEGEGLLRGFFRSWKALSWPPSHCPKCENILKWYDNLPVIGWIKLGGRCRFCKAPISIRYPIVEVITGLLFLLYYLMFFVWGYGPGLQRMMSDGVIHFYPAQLLIAEHWPIYFLDMLLISGLLAASLIDAELFIIPLEIPWCIVPFALLEHALFDGPGWPGSLNLSAPAAALAGGAGLGVLLSFILWNLGMLPTSFADGGPLLEVEKKALAEQSRERQFERQGRQASATLPATSPEMLTEREYTPRQIRAEMRKEMLFLLPPLALGLTCVLLTWNVEPIGRFWSAAMAHQWVGGLLGSVLGLLIGGLVVWLTRILGSMAFGREAMGMGDVHLMAAVGATLGAGPAVVAFFLAPFFGMVLVIYMMIARKGRELPYGPYLSLASAFVMLFYVPIADYLSPGVTGLFFVLSRSLHGG